jgi:antibiotic biosynthesis monooxygenase (ABM) superfamily enzyme
MTGKTCPDPSAGAAPLAPLAPPSVHVRVLITWLAVYPSILVAKALLSPVAGGVSGPLRLLCVTAVVVPVVVYVLVPWLLKARARLLRVRRR